MNLSDNLKKIRKDNNLSQEQLAEKLGVSRQSVSKWESGVAYPEMDKVLQLCKMFNLNIDELLNQDIKEVRETKEVKTKRNKYLDDFLNFISKTSDMFSSMNFKTKLKCIIEQIIIVFLLIILFSGLGVVLNVILSKLFRFIYYTRLYDLIFDIFGAFYIVLAIVLGVIIFLQIFKTRYLDYYTVVKNKNIKLDTIDEVKNIEKEQDKITLSKSPSTIIIRDPKHSSYSFIKSLLNLILYMIKALELFIAFILILILIFQTIGLVMSSLIVKTGLLFIGCIIIVVASILLNLIILHIIYNSIFNKKTNKFKTSLIFISSVMFIGLGIGLIPVSLKDFNYIQNIDSNYYVEDVKTIDMNDKLYLDLTQDIEFIETDSDKIQIICRHSKFDYLSLDISTNNILHIYLNDNSNFIKELKQYIDDLNDKTIVDYSNYKIYIKTSKENIQKLKENLNEYYDRIDSLESDIRYYLNRIDELNKEINSKSERNLQLENELKEKTDKLNELQEIINNYIKEEDI